MKNNHYKSTRNMYHLIPQQSQQGQPPSMAPPPKHVVHNIVYDTPDQQVGGHPQYYSPISQQGYYYASRPMHGKAQNYYGGNPYFLEAPMSEYGTMMGEGDDMPQHAVIMSSPPPEYDEPPEDEYMYDQVPVLVPRVRNEDIRYVHRNYPVYQRQPPPPQSPQQQHQPTPHPYHLQQRAQHRQAPTYLNYHQKYRLGNSQHHPQQQQYRVQYPLHHRVRMQQPAPQQQQQYRHPQYQPPQRQMYYKGSNVMISPEETMPYIPVGDEEEYESNEVPNPPPVALDEIFDVDPIFDEFDYNDEVDDDSYFHEQLPNPDEYEDSMMNMDLASPMSLPQFPSGYRPKFNRTAQMGRPIQKGNRKVQQPITKMLKKAKSTNTLRPKSVQSTAASTPASAPTPTTSTRKKLKEKNYDSGRQLTFDECSQTFDLNQNNKKSSRGKKSSASTPNLSGSVNNQMKYSFVFEAGAKKPKRRTPSSTASTPAGATTAGVAANIATPATENTTPATTATPMTGLLHKKTDSGSSGNSFTVSPVIIDNEGFNTFSVVSPK